MSCVRPELTRPPRGQLAAEAVLNQLNLSPERRADVIFGGEIKSALAFARQDAKTVPLPADVLSRYTKVRASERARHGLPMCSREHSQEQLTRPPVGQQIPRALRKRRASGPTWRPAREPCAAEPIFGGRT